MARLQWKNLSPKNFGFPNYKGTMDSSAIGTWLTDTDEDNQNAMLYLKAVADKYGSDALYDLLKYGDDEEADNPDSLMTGISALIGDEAIDEIMSDINNPDLWNKETGVDILEDSGSGEGMTPDEIEKYFNNFGVDYVRGDTNTQGETSYTVRGKPNDINSLLTDFNSMSNPGYKLPWDRKDVNGDGDTDLQVADTNGNGKPDTAIVTADSKSEEKEAIKAAKESLGFDKKDKTSTGKTKGELDDDTSVVSDKKKKNVTCSDVTQKNILSALIDRRF